MTDKNVPLVVDLDGTLIHTDMLHESAIHFVKHHALSMWKLPVWLKKGKAQLKAFLASQWDFNPQTLPYHVELLDYLRQEKANGRSLILCTASDETIARKIADDLGIFDEVMASDGVHNLAGKHKADALVNRFGLRGFDYAGNSADDLWVWQVSREAIAVNVSSDVLAQLKQISVPKQVFVPAPLGYRDAWRVLRVHQWLKNGLLFVPLLAAHDLLNVGAIAWLLLAFLSFSLCASAVYILNDLLDLENDRAHPRKKNRPFASSRVPVVYGVWAIFPLWLLSVLLAMCVSGDFVACLLAYFVLTCAYSFVLKRIMLIDCVALALLYTARIVSGAVTLGHQLSFWLLAFSIFLFLSLAFIKRFTELSVYQQNAQTHKLSGRDYEVSDAPLIQMMGIVSGYASVIVLALYLNSDAVLQMYRTPQMMWGAVLVMLYWISWMWVQAHRGKMFDDPVLFAVKKRPSLICGVLFVVVLFLGTVGES